MEGTGRDPARAVALELHITAHHIHDVEPFLDGANGIPRLHTAEAPPGRKHDGAPCRTRFLYDKAAGGLVKAQAKKFFAALCVLPRQIAHPADEVVAFRAFYA